MLHAEPPALVAANPAALSYWQGFLATAVRGGLHPTDLPILARLCMALAYADDANRRVAEAGLLVQNPTTKMPMPNPYLTVMDSQTQIAAKLSAQLNVQLRGW